MSTIAWDGKTLAADCAAWSCGIKRKVRKIFEIEIDGKRHLIGYCGDLSWCIAATKALIGESSRPDWRDYKMEIVDEWALLVNQRGQAFKITADFVWHEVVDGWCAMGGGREVAAGALLAGASAERTIEICAQLTDYAAMGVDSLRF